MKPLRRCFTSALISARKIHFLAAVFENDFGYLIFNVASPAHLNCSAIFASTMSPLRAPDGYPHSHSIAPGAS